MSRLTSHIDIEGWRSRLGELSESYQREKPFPHIVLDDFLDPESARKCAADFPGIADERWFHFHHYNSRKYGLDQAELMPDSVRELIEELNSRAFVEFLEGLTGIDHLLADEGLEGGGLHQSARGGFLNVHADFTIHPRIENWRRRVNVLVYLNPEWKEEYGGHLELWPRDMKHCEQRILPVLNRCVVLNTEEEFYHGHPVPLACPEGVTRRSIALYYFTEEQYEPRVASTNYRARPADKSRRLLIALDNLALRFYKALVRSFGLKEDFTGRILKRLHNGVRRRNDS